jgi:hypothetical protein
MSEKEIETINNMVNLFLNGKKYIHWRVINASIPSTDIHYNCAIQAARILCKKHGFNIELFNAKRGIFSGFISYN